MTLIKEDLIKHFNLNNEAYKQSTKKYISYGTAGFRGKAGDIEHLFYKIGLFCGFKCISSAANIGVMITASHNPEQDNGVKIIESDGSMISPEWENIVEELSNINDPESFYHKLIEVKEAWKVDIDSRFEATAPKLSVLLGMDTRSSCAKLSQLFLDGLNFWQNHKIDVVNYGCVTTPALHFLTRDSNVLKKPIAIELYYDKLAHGLAKIFSKKLSTFTPHSNYDPKSLVIDCSNGVGYETMKNLLQRQDFAAQLPYEMINCCASADTGARLNFECGADFVKTTELAPLNANDATKRYASLDGDADRLIYFYMDEAAKADDQTKQKVHVLDGDKIAVLFAIYILELLEKTNLRSKLSFVMVSTAYANGASTDYRKNALKLDNIYESTGVKNLHREAVLHDMAVYFEANGHGTIWISEKAERSFKDVGCAEFDELLDILNNSTGDAVSSILIVEMILRHYDWSIQKWDSIYQDRPNSLTKLEVPDKNVIKVEKADTVVVAPKELAEAIEEEVKLIGGSARSVVRPSGTENIVRVYSEADNQEKADELSMRICKRITEICK